MLDSSTFRNNIRLQLLQIASRDQGSQAA